MNVRQSLLKVCKWVLRNSNWDAVSLETIIRFEGYEGLRVFHVLIIIMALRLMRVMRVYEGFECKYLTSSCIYYWFRTFNDWRTLNTTYIYIYIYEYLTLTLPKYSYILTNCERITNGGQIWPNDKKLIFQLNFNQSRLNFIFRFRYQITKLQFLINFNL